MLLPRECESVLKRGFVVCDLYVSPACPGAACPRRPPASAARRGGGPEEREEEEEAAAMPRLAAKFPFARGELCRRVRFDMRGRDVIVFLHIQKTGGTTFGRHLVRNIHLEQPCYCRAGQKKCACHRPGGDKDTWLFSRFSTGWSCGLHADWTELTSCVPAAMERRGCAGNRTLRSVPASQICSESDPTLEPVFIYLIDFGRVLRSHELNSLLNLCTFIIVTSTL
uniref:Heparan-sulfate 6-O-sulfotransferase n=1 Tax=Catharus ustulatus TaxID=91951 RepID=A0A8C3USU7_CATUS